MNTLADGRAGERSLTSNPTAGVRLFALIFFFSPIPCWTDLHQKFSFARADSDCSSIEFKTEVPRTAVLARDWPAIRVFYHGLLSPRRALLLATRVNTNSTNRSAISNRAPAFPREALALPRAKPHFCYRILRESSIRNTRVCRKPRG